MDSNVQLVKNVLKYTFSLVPIVAGLDKFTNLLTNWSQYISEGFANILPFEPSTFMMIVGVIEIIAGILVLTKTKIGAYVVSGWLVAIALTLIFSWSYVDVAVRDLVMAIAAFSLAKLSKNSHSKAKN
ncbi:tRNA (5-methylaminomethyl-2-thiouridylate)-methyltransferase [Flavobacteriales bacterium ALC-1]|nr:tRNA (5-methylaminomethyl-2-thiouridylate)-methyltransferase [Flavobacteriales bacterium ALC-1]